MVPKVSKALTIPNVNNLVDSISIYKIFVAFSNNVDFRAMQGLSIPMIQQTTVVLS